MTQRLILASGSRTRAEILENAGVPFEVVTAPIDEEGLRRSLQAEDVTPRDISDALAEMKALRVSRKHPEALVIGCDQILALGDEIFVKPETRDRARDQLIRLRGQRHSLFSAAVAYDGGEPVWRHVSEVKLRMHTFTDSYLDGYLDRNWPGIGHAAGGYQVEKEGIRLFSDISGDYFSVLGMPLMPLLAWLGLRGVIER